jgi:hypothetical protein
VLEDKFVLFQGVGLFVVGGVQIELQQLMEHWVKWNIIQWWEG